jgi:ferric-dicitrate binding protein FerR (iron transport regulator)
MRTLFRKYINGTCSPDEFRQIEEFINKQGNNGQISDLMHPHFSDSMRNAPTIEPNPQLLDRIKTAIQLSEGQKARKKVRRLTLALRVAAVLIVALLVGSLLIYTTALSEKVVVDLQTYSSPNGAKASFSLPDGTQVWLNSGSTLTFPGSFGKQRPVSLKGEAYFEVVKSEIPFTVNTDKGKVTVKGTSFDVKAYPDEEFVTTLERGKVEVAAAATNNRTELKPGQQAQISDGKIVVKEVDPQQYTSWKDGKLIFRKAYLPEVAKRLERWYNVKIILDNDQRLEKIWFTGTIEMESFSEVLGLLRATSPIDYTYHEKSRTIKITYSERKTKG